MAEVDEMSQRFPIISSGVGPDVAVLHGYPAGPEYMDAAVAGLHDRFCVHVVDTSQATLSDEEMVEALELTLTEGGLAGAHVLGHSIGGYRALHLAVRGRVEMASVVAIGGFPRLPEETLESYEGMATQVELGELDVAAVATPLWFGEPFLTAHPETIEQVRAWSAAVNDGTIAEQLRVFGHGPHLLAELSKISQPVLFIVGDLDIVTPVTWSEEMAAEISSARVEVVPRSGHFPFMENPTAFFSGLREFLLVADQAVAR